MKEYESIDINYHTNSTVSFFTLIKICTNLLNKCVVNFDCECDFERSANGNSSFYFTFCQSIITSSMIYEFPLVANLLRQFIRSSNRSESNWTSGSEYVEFHKFNLFSHKYEFVQSDYLPYFLQIFENCFVRINWNYEICMYQHEVRNKPFHTNKALFQ